MLTLLIILVLWLAQSLRYMDLIINNSVSMNAYFGLVAYLIPDLFGVISPIAFAVATLFCFHRLIISHELAALRSLGLNNFRLSLPVLSLAAGLFAFLLFLNIVIVPTAFQKLKEQEHVMRSAFSGALLKEGTFNTSKGFTIYIREHNDKDELNGIFIYQPAENQQPSYTTIAKSGRVYKSGERIFILLKKGERQDYSPITRQYACFSFDEFVYDLTDKIISSDSRPERISEKSITQLLNPDPSLSIEMKRRFKSEAHQRLLLPFLCLLDALFIASMLLSGELSRRYSKKNLIIAAAGVLLAHIITMGLLHGSVRSDYLLWVAYAFVFSGILGSFAFLTKDLSLGSSIKKQVVKTYSPWEKR